MAAIARHREARRPTVPALAWLLQLAGAPGPATPGTALPRAPTGAGAWPLAHHSLARLPGEAPAPRTALLGFWPAEPLSGRAGHTLLHFVPVSGGHRLTGAIAFSQNRHLRRHITRATRSLWTFEAVGVVYTWGGPRGGRPQRWRGHGPTQATAGSSSTQETLRL